MTVTETAAQNLHAGCVARPVGVEHWREVQKVCAWANASWEVLFTDGTSEVTGRYLRWEVRR
jgi:hypothetical protein